MADRRLATVRVIEEITPIENSDNLELVRVDGWKVVVSKSENHKVGDLVVYCEIDSFLPRWEEFHFLAKNSYRKMGDLEGYRLRTIKLRGQISEGLIIPLKFDEETGFWYLTVDSQNIRTSVQVDEEVTDILGIQKWEPPVPAQLAGKIKGNFPSFIPKTDQERIENFYKYFDRNYRDHKWEVSVKLDGSSFTAYVRNGEFGVCSRNLDIIETEGNAFWQAANKNGLRDKMLTLSEDWGDFAIQAELMGPGVQGNREGFKELDIYVFDAYWIGLQDKMFADERSDLVEVLGLKHVPVLDPKASFKSFNSAADFLEFAEGPSINHAVREGLVFKSLTDANVSFKAISKTFLLKQKD